MVEPDRLFQGLLNRHSRVQGGIGILEDHLHLAAVGQRSLTFQIINPLAAIVDLSGARREQPHHGAGDGGFATTGLADHTQGFALLHIQVHTVDGVHRFLFAAQTPTFKPELLKEAAREVKTFFQTADTYQRGGHDSASCMRFSCSIRLATS